LRIVLFKVEFDALLLNCLRFQIGTSNFQTHLAKATIIEKANGVARAISSRRSATRGGDDSNNVVPITKFQQRSSSFHNKLLTHLFPILKSSSYCINAFRVF
jgi:hypothetical protein